MQSPGWIRKFHRSRAADPLPLLIFPHAGSGASAYRALSKAFSADFDVFVFQYPGRQDRANEPALTSLADIAAGAFAEFRASAVHRGLPFVTFGHSMGSLVSFEFVQLAEAAGMPVNQAVISAAVAPCRGEHRTPAPTDDDELLDHLAKLEGTGSDVLASRELMRMALPAIKADHRASDAYRCDPGIKIATRIHAIGGDRDPIVGIADLNGWRQHSGDVEVTVFDGGHFYLNDHIADLAELVAESARSGSNA
ncbi:alpha/beta fold hydrolase [Nocardia zapadnayensis]|uniref:thioesterase II family protein n=1 Tax=Nocardia rhamnosiphila TaxID=426716 RepID=UPI0022476F87|nr:alpha/beta fold hydrolase [Nocardia zapadnayensis]MCX0269585.1 alpha/beta fold hydrolase [Nocardia zapadnayensis]